MARKTVDKLGDPVVVPQLGQTGTAKKFENEEVTDGGTPPKIIEIIEHCHVEVDHSHSEKLMKKFLKKEVFKFRWSSRRKDQSFLFIARAWKDRFGQRHYRIQSHRIFSDGVLWWRKIHYESIDGKEVRPVANVAVLREKVTGQLPDDKSDGQA